MILQPIERDSLARQHHGARRGEIEPLCPIDLRKGSHRPAAWWPFDLEHIAVDRLRIEIALADEEMDQLAARLPKAAERDERAGDRNAGFLLELPRGSGGGILIILYTALRNLPRAGVTIPPERATGMDQQDGQAVNVPKIEQ